MKSFKKMMPLRQGFLYVLMMVSIMFLLIIVSSATKAQNITQDPLYGEKLAEYQYFRIVEFDEIRYMVDYNGTIEYNKNFIVLKSSTFGVPDKIIKLVKKAKNIKGKTWYGEELYTDIKVYVKINKKKLIAIYYIEEDVEVYFISTKLKDDFFPLPQYGIWYQDKE